MADARKLFAQGSELFLAKKYGDALEVLRKSYELVPSPNSGLLIARCLRELGQPVESSEMFSLVEADARKRVSEGDAKYLKAAEAAVTEGAAVRATIGSIRIRLLNAPAGTTLEVGGRPVALTGQEMVIWRIPGDVTVKVTTPDGSAQSTGVTVGAGGQARVELDLRSRGTASTGLPVGGPDPSPDRPHSNDRAWALPAAYVSTGVAVLGFGAFAGFGLASQSIYDDLKNRCGATGCGPADRPDADTGKRYQTLANGGLVLGLVGGAAALTFFVLAATATNDDTTKLPKPDSNKKSSDGSTPRLVWPGVLLW